MSAATEAVITIAGWTGAISAVVAYGLVSAKRVSPDSLQFQLLNLVGAILLSISSTIYGAWPSAVVNMIWVGIGIFTLRTMWRKYTSSKRATVEVSVDEDLPATTPDPLAEACNDDAERNSSDLAPVAA